jgi:hypothetical protein
MKYTEHWLEIQALEVLAFENAGGCVKCAILHFHSQRQRLLSFRSNWGAMSHAARYVVTRVAVPSLFPPPDTFPRPFVMAELDTDLYGG